MSAKEQINRAMPGALAGGIVTLIITFIFFGVNKADTNISSYENRLKNVEVNKVDKGEMKEAIDIAKKEMDLKRDADYRVLKNDIQYIKDGIDELKARR